MALDIFTTPLPEKTDTERDRLGKLLQSAAADGISIPMSDYVAYTYVASGAADNDRISTATYKTGGSGGTTVATLTFTYVGSTNNVASITKS